MRALLRPTLATLILLAGITFGVFVLGNYRTMRTLDQPIGYMADASAMYAMRGIGLAGHPFASRMSAPFNHELNPVPDTAKCFAFSMECSIVRGAGWFTADPFRIVNIYYFLVYYLCGLAALWVLRGLGTGWAIAIAGALLYALLPYHFMRMVNHLSVGNYALVPLFMLVCVWVHDLGATPGDGTRVCDRQLPRALVVASVVLSVTWGLTNDYYVLMFVLFLWFAALKGSQGFTRRPPLIGAGLVTLGLFVSFGLQKLLTRWSWGSHAGVNFGTFQLSGYGADELYPLKLIQLLLPGPTNRIHALRHMNQVYSASHPLVNENNTDVLGLALAIGLIALLVVAFFGSARTSSRDRFLGRGALLALLIGAMGGIGTLLSEASWHLFGGRFPLSQARAWNRVYVFLAFIVLIYVASHANDWLRRLRARALQAGHATLGGVLGAALVATVTGAALYYQVPHLGHAWVHGNNQRYLVDKAYFHQLDQHYASAYQVFYWPAMIPWGGKYGQEYYTVAYHPLLASRKLVTSYGGAPGTEAATWLAATAAEPPAALVQTLCAKGFDGVLVFNRALRPADEPLATFLGQRPPLLKDSYHTYYPLAPVCSKPSLSQR